MLGNVEEWTSDNYDTSNKKVVRGGSWLDNRVVRASIRVGNHPSGRFSTIGFRCVELR
jgi:formylglycine-generating enzyme required for sulfatase activity